MPSPSRLMGSYQLTADSVAQHVPEQAPGVFALGFEGRGVFTVLAVGRADSDLRAPLKAQAQRGKYLSFKYLPAQSAKEAFELECALYHEFGGERHLDNNAHPAREAGANWRCPHCTFYGIPDWGALAR